MLNKMKLCRSSSSSTSESKHWIKLPKSFSMRQSSVHQARPEAILPIKCSDLERHQRIKSIAGGTVYYKVVHKPTGRLYSLKVIHGHHEEPVRRQIVREFQALRNVDNPNIVKCYDMFEHKGTIQVLLEYTDGGCLKDKYVPNEKTLAALARQVLAGLACLHGKHVVHRDIKPSNLLINYLNQVKIADYVGSNVAQTMDPCNSTVGNVAYMCPERIDVDPNRGKVVDPCAGDIWSFGISILELYMGRYPFPVDRYEQGQWACLTLAICMSQPPQAPPTASREFRHFIRCCLRKEPSKRWPAAQLLQHPFISGNGGGMTYS